MSSATKRLPRRMRSRAHSLLPTPLRPTRRTPTPRTSISTPWTVVDSRKSRWSCLWISSMSSAVGRAEEKSGMPRRSAASMKDGGTGIDELTTAQGDAPEKNRSAISAWRRGILPEEVGDLRLAEDLHAARLEGERLPGDRQPRLVGAGLPRSPWPRPSPPREAASAGCRSTPFGRSSRRSPPHAPFRRVRRVRLLPAGPA